MAHSPPSVKRSGVRWAVTLSLILWCMCSARANRAPISPATHTNTHARTHTHTRVHTHGASQSDRELTKDSYRGISAKRQLHLTGPPPVQAQWSGINTYYLWACNASVRAEVLDSVRAAGLRVLRVFIVSTQGGGVVSACPTEVPDVEPQSVGVWNDTILERLDALMTEASLRGIKLTIALHDRWSLGCWRSDAYQRKYNLTQVNCATHSDSNDPSRFYSDGRSDFTNRIRHVLQYSSKITGIPLGQRRDALFSIEAENEAFGHSSVAPNEDWMCQMSTVIRSLIAPTILVTTGGGGIGSDKNNELKNVAMLSKCSSIDVIAVHSYSPASGIDLLLAAYRRAIQSSKKRLILQEWGVVGQNSTAKAVKFSEVAGIALRHGIPQLYWGLQPSHLPAASTIYEISPPSPAPSPGNQRVRSTVRGSNGQWINRCTNTSCPTEVWVTALYPAAQAAALATADAGWPEIWGCTTPAHCGYNGECKSGICECFPAWRGPTCSALNLLPTPMNNGYRDAKNASSWGGSIMHGKDGKYHMFASRITEGCGLNDWSTNSEIIRATADAPVGPYVFQEVVVDRFAHEPNVVFGTDEEIILLASSYPVPPKTFPNCSRSGLSSVLPTCPPTVQKPARNTYMWTAATPEDISKVERQLAISAVLWDSDPLHGCSICDTNAAAAIYTDGSLVGLWRHCETENLHTVPHTFTALQGTNGSTYTPNTSISVPFMAHAGAEDPMVYTQVFPTGDVVLHAIMHDEQITRCADAPVGCWPGGRHAFSVDRGLTWDYSPFDAYNGTVEYADGTIRDYYLRARPHMVLDSNGKIVALSNGLRPEKASDSVFTLVQPVAQ